VSVLLNPFTQLLTSIRTVWTKLSKHIDKDTAKLVFVTLTVLLIFETVLGSLLISLVVLHYVLS
jgi:hypothetical protein